MTCVSGIRTHDHQVNAAPMITNFTTESKNNQYFIVFKCIHVFSKFYARLTYFINKLENSSKGILIH